MRQTCLCRFPDDRNQGKRRQGQHFVDSPKYRSHNIQRFYLPQSKCTAAQQSSVQPLRDNPDMIELKHLFQLKIGADDQLL
jgi:hypothetical protein